MRNPEKLTAMPGRRRCLPALLSLSFLSSCLGSDPEPAAPTDAAQVEAESAPTSKYAAAIKAFMNDALGRVDAEDVKKELEKGLLRDITADTEGGDAPLVLSKEDEQSARLGLEMGLIKNPHDAEAVAREIGEMGKGLLGGQKLRFSDQAEFRCQAKEANDVGFLEEVLVSQSVLDSVALLRFRPNNSPVMAGVVSWSVRRKVVGGDLQYTNDPDTRFLVRGGLNIPHQREGSATLQTVLDGEPYYREFSCIRTILEEIEDPEEAIYIIDSAFNAA
jgi:hypothetical protein